MSGGQIGSVIGGAIGFVLAPATGGASLIWAANGIAIGGMIGSLLMPDKTGVQDQNGPRLSDLKVSTSSYGLPINNVYGAYRVGGNIIWNTDIMETKHVTEEEVGKGGGSETYEVTTYSYDVSFAVGLCAGPVTGIRKVWADGVLIYDGNAQTAFYGSSEYVSGPMDMFYGDEDQVVDWYMQSYHADTPAYRNLCYIRFNHLQLEKFGNRIPNITAEVIVGGVRGVRVTKVYEADFETNYLAPDAYVRINYLPDYNFLYDYNPEAPPQNIFLMTFDGYKTYISTHYGGSSRYQGYSNIFLKYTESDRIQHITNEQIAFEGDTIHGGGTVTPYRTATVFSHHKNTNGGFFTSGSHFWGSNYLRYHTDPTSLIKFDRIINVYNPTGNHGQGLNAYHRMTTEMNEKVFYKDHFYCLEISVSLLEGYGCLFKGKGSKSYPEIDRSIYYGLQTWWNYSYNVYGKPQEGSLHAIIGVDAYPPGGDNPIGMDVNYDKVYILSGRSIALADPHHAYIKIYSLEGVWEKTVDISNDIDWFWVKESDGHHLRIFVQDGYIHIITWTLYSIQHGQTHIKYTLDGQKVSYTSFEIPSAIPNGLDRKVYQYHSGLIKVFDVFGTRGNQRVLDYVINLNYISNSITLQTITDHLCKRSGLDEIDYNNIEGNLVSVGGFNIEQNSGARSSIAALQSVFLFDLVEEDFQLKIKLRGRPPSGVVINEDGVIDDTFDLRKKILTELPRKITLKYSSQKIDYQISSQSIVRIDGDSDNNIILEVPLTATDDEAKQLVEKLMFSTYNGSTSISFKTPFDSEVKISDVITLTYDSMTYSLRIDTVIYEQYSMAITSTLEGSSIYESTAIGTDVSEERPPNDVFMPTESVPVVFNGPTLDNSLLDSFSIYYTAYGFSSTAWKGSEVYKSKDNSSTYSSIGLILNNTTSAIGQSVDLLGPAKSTVWDVTNVIKVHLSFGTLFDSTYSEVLSGKNYVKVGDEILQYTLATLTGTNVYELTGLLRGRRGTEWAIDKHTNMELFVFLNTEIFANGSTLNKTRDYKAVSFGSFLDDARSVTETYLGTNLIPFSPSYVYVDSDTIYWTRRDRYISGFFRTLPYSETQEKYKVDLYYLGVLIFTVEVVGATSYTYDTVTYPDVDAIIVSQFSDNLMEYGYTTEIQI